MGEDIDRLAELIWSTFKLRVTILVIAIPVILIVWSSLEQGNTNAPSVDEMYCQTLAQSYSRAVREPQVLGGLLHACSSQPQDNLDTARIVIEHIRNQDIAALEDKFSEYDGARQEKYKLKQEFWGNEVVFDALPIAEAVPFIGLLLVTTVVILGWREKHYKRQLTILLESVQPGDRPLALARSRFLVGIPYKAANGDGERHAGDRLVASGPEPLILGILYGGFVFSLAMLLRNFSNNVVHLTDSVFFSYSFSFYSATFVSAWLLLNTWKEYRSLLEPPKAAPKAHALMSNPLIRAPKFALAVTVLALLSFAFPWIMSLDYNSQPIYLHRTPVAKGYQFLLKEKTLVLEGRPIVISPRTFGEIRIQLWFAILFLALCQVDALNKLRPFLTSTHRLRNIRRWTAVAILFLSANYWVYMCVMLYQLDLGTPWPLYLSEFKGVSVVSMINFAPDYGFFIFTLCCAYLIWLSFRPDREPEAEALAPAFAVPEANEA